MALRFIETDIAIDAPAADVWRVISDLSSWSDWHPFVARVRGDVAPGGRVVLDKNAPGGRTIALRQVVASVEEGVEFRLAGTLLVRGLLDNEHRFRVEPIDETRSRFFHGQAFRGFLVRLMIRKRGASTYEVFEEVNRALKRRVESGGKAAGG